MGKITILGTIFAAGVCVTLAPLARADAAGALRWYPRVESAAPVALEGNKPLMIDFQAAWCEPCNVMEKTVYTDRRILSASEGFVLVRIDYDGKPEVARKYDVTSLPTLLFTDSYGDELLRSEGFLDAKTLSDAMRALPANVSEFNAFSQVLAKDRNNSAALEGMGNSLHVAGLFAASNLYYGKALQRPEVKADAGMREAIMNRMTLNSLAVKDGVHAAAMLERCLREFPNSAQKASWTQNLRDAKRLSGESK